MEDGVRTLYVGASEGVANALAERADVAVVAREPDDSAAVDALADRDFECVVCRDAPLGVDPLDVLRRVGDVDPALPVVLYATDGSEALAADAVSAGVTDYVRGGDGALERLGDAVVAAAHRRRAERDVAKLNDLARSVYERVTDAFVAFDEEWRVTYLNREAERLLGRRAERAIGERACEVFPDAANSALGATLARALDGRERVHADGVLPGADERVDVHAYPSAGGLSVHFRRAGGDGDRDPLDHLQGVLSSDLTDAVEDARASLDAARTDRTDAALDELEDALDRVADLVDHSVALAAESGYERTNSTG